MEWFFYTSFTTRPLRETVGISGVKGAKWMFFTSEDDSQKKKKMCTQTPQHTHTQSLRESGWFIVGPLRRHLWAVDFVTAEQERNNFMDVEMEQQALTEPAKITGNQPWPLQLGGEKRMTLQKKPYINKMPLKAGQAESASIFHN